MVGDPTEGALLVLAHKAGLDLDSTRQQYPRVATLPFDPTYKLMAVFAAARDDAGHDVVRCFVKGAAPAVMRHAGGALSAGRRIPWDDASRLGRRPTFSGWRRRAAGDGRRRPRHRLRGVRRGRDLLAYVDGLDVTSLVGMVDPPRAESHEAVSDAQQAHIRVRMVTGDDVITGAAIARQLGIDGEAILGAEFAALSDEERLSRIDQHRRRRPGGAGAQGAAR